MNRSKLDTLGLTKDPILKEVIRSLWREYPGLYGEKYTLDPETDKVLLRSSIAETVSFGQFLGQDHIIEGNQSLALGIGHTTTSYREMLMGSYATEMAGTADAWVATDRLWGVGNGVDDLNRHDALVMYKSGFMQMGNAIALKAYDHGALPAPAGAMQYTALKGFEGYRDDVWQRFALINPTVGAGILTLSAAGAIGSIEDRSADWTAAYNYGPHAGLYAPSSTVSFPGFGTTHTLAAYGDHTHNYEPAITKGTTLQYFRGDMSLATFPTSMPASDVYSWAKAVSKPSYTYSEVGAAPSSTVSFPGFGTTHTLAAYGDHTHSGIYEPVIAKGTTLQYFRGDMSLATFPTSMPASDVYSWAKAVSKPSYTYSEVGAAPSSTVSFPGFGTTHTLAAYGDHTHSGVYEPKLPAVTGSYNKFLRINNGNYSWTTRGYLTMDEAYWSTRDGQVITKVYAEDGMIYGISYAAMPVNTDTNYYPTALSISGNNLSLTGVGMTGVSAQLFYSSGDAYGAAGFAARVDHSHTYPYEGQVRITAQSNYGTLNNNYFTANSGDIVPQIASSVTGGNYLPVSSSAVATALANLSYPAHNIQSHSDVYIPTTLGAGNVNEALIWGGSSWNSGKPWTNMGYLTGITKAQVEAALTGTISSHSHALPSHSITAHSDVSFTYYPSSGDLMQYNGSAWTQRSIYNCGIAALAGSLSQQFSVLKLNLPGGAYVEVQGTTIHFYSGSTDFVFHGTVKADGFWKN